MTDIHDQRRGEEARRLLSEPLLTEAFAVVDVSLRDAWANTTDAQERERERLWLMVKLLARVKGHLQSAIEDGQVAAATIEQGIADAA